MTRSRIRTTGPLGTVVVLAFLTGLVSAPVRPCFSHEGHPHGSFAQALVEPETAGGAPAGHHGHHAGEAGTPEDAGQDGPPGGCECLGHCQVESSQFLPIGYALAHLVEPDSRATCGPYVALLGPAGAPHAIPLARGPPAHV